MCVWIDQAERKGEKVPQALIKRKDQIEDQIDDDLLHELGFMII